MTDSQLHNTLRAYINSEILHDPNYPLGDNEALISGGLIDSFSLVNLALWVEQEFGVPIPDSDLNADTFDTLAQLVAFIDNHSR
jgi:acyl carrier protein